MKRLLWLGLLLMTLEARAQFDVSFANYWSLQSFYNPAATGLDGMLNVQGAYSMQMVGFEDAPATMYVGADLPVFFLSPRHGMGVCFLNDKAGLFSTTKIALQYAYHLPLLKGNLSFGGRAAMLSEGFDGTEMKVRDSSDPVFATSQVKGNSFDLDVGLRYSYKNVWYVGASAMHCLGPDVTIGDDKNYEVKLDPTLYLTGGYRVGFREPRYCLYTSAKVQSDMHDWRADVTGRLTYEGSRHKLYGGLSYAPTRSVTVLLGMDFHGINLGYAYEIYTRGIGAINGTHELVLGYQTDLNLFKKGKNMHKSVRIL